VDPKRDDLIAVLGETTGTVALCKCRDRMRADEVGAALLQERPNISTAVLEQKRLDKLPVNTFGRAYFDLMAKHGFDADGRRPVRFIEDEELRFVMQRYRQVHDFWHVLTGLPPTVLGEIALKWFEMIHTELPVATLSAIAGPFGTGMTPRKREILFERYVPWACRAGLEAKFLLNVRYEDLLDKDLDEVREQLRIEAAPKAPNAPKAKPS